MPIFQYTVLEGPGARIQGAIEADNRNAAIDALGRRGVHLVSIEERRSAAQASGRKLGLKDVAEMTRQLGRLAKGGISIGEALALLEENPPTAAVLAHVAPIRKSIIEGQTFSDAISARGDAFPVWYSSMIRAGEISGTLAVVLDQLSIILRREMDLRSKVRGALAYPALMLGVGIITVVILLVFVIPSISALFVEAGQSLPLPTYVLVQTSSFLQSSWYFILAFIVAVALVMRAALARPRVRAAVDAALLKVPLLGPLLLQASLARLCRVLGTLIGNGVPLLEALRATAATIPNTAVAGAVSGAVSKIEHGGSLSGALQDDPIFPPALGQIVATAERAGAVEASLLDSAVDYEDDIERSIALMMSMLEPLLIILVGGAIGFIVIALLLPIFEVNELIQ